MSAGEEFRDDARRGLPADVVRRLNELDAGKAWLCVAETFAVLAACIGLSLAFRSPWVVAPALLLIATRQQALFVLAHDAAHYRLFPQRWLNDAMGGLCGALAGVSMRTYRVVHRLHHNHLYGRRTPTFRCTAAIRAAACTSSGSWPRTCSAAPPTRPTPISSARPR